MNVSLTGEQRLVADHRQGPALVLAGAGSGKTTTISVRTIQMLREGCPPDRILQLTFSRKAAGEMRHRMVKLAGSLLMKGLSIDTFHAFGYRLIREFPERFGRTKSVTVVDDSDQRRIFRDAARGAGLDLKERRVKLAAEKARSVYSLCKNSGLRMPQDREAIEELVRFNINALDDVIRRLMSAIDGYETSLRKQNVVDFDDLNLLPGLELDRDPAFAEMIGRRYLHIVVDESQDTNLTQYWILRAFARFALSVVAVGDGRQAIYGFRGARMENIRSFIEDFEPRQYLMRQNFRSTIDIVEGANALIAHNATDMGESSSEIQGGMGYTVISAPDASSGIRMIQSKYQELSAAGIPPQEIAFLGRVKRLSRLAEVAMSQLGVQSRIVGGFSIFESIEGRAALGAARLRMNPYDGTALSALAVFHPLLTDGLVSKALDGVAAGLTVYESLRMAGGKGGEAAADIEERLQRLTDAGATEVGAWVMSEWGLNMLGHFESKKQRSKTTSAEEIDKECERRQENLILVDLATRGAIARLADERAGRELDPGEHEAWVDAEEQWRLVVESRLDDRDEGKAPPKNAVTISTIHRAKGLEFGAVIVLGASESILPLTKADDDDDEDGADDGIEEERRLAYVAVTRAKVSCTLVHIEDLSRFVNRNGLLHPSRFIEELGLSLPVQRGPGEIMVGGSQRPYRASTRTASGAPW